MAPYDVALYDVALYDVATWQSLPASQVRYAVTSVMATVAMPHTAPATTTGLHPTDR
jgi:hypothetical protein